MRSLLSFSFPAASHAVHLLAALLLLAGCGGPFDPAAPGAEGVWISDTAFELQPGESVGLVGRLSSLNGGAPADPRFEWSSSRPEVVQASSSGRVTGVAPGTAVVTVRFGPHADSATVFVGPRPEEPVAWRSVHAGEGFTCALTQAGERYCWGANPFGAHGNGVRRLHAATHAPLPAGDPLRYVQLTAGQLHACGLTMSGAAYCWGNNSGRSSFYELRPQPIATPTPLRELASGSAHTCGVDGSGVRYCWGSNLVGALGTTTSSARQVAPLRVDEPMRFVSLAAGGSHGCGIAVERDVYCWGTNESGQVGTGSFGAIVPLPERLVGAASFVALSAGNAQTCGLTSDGEAYCWGRIVRDLDGEIAFAASAVPMALPTPLRFTQLAAGGSQTCGVTVDGEAYCWGGNADGEAGVDPLAASSCRSAPDAGPASCLSLPHLVSTSLRFTQLSAGTHHTCGVTRDREIYCWGRNDRGQLGVGRIVASTAVPTRVAPAVR